HRSSVGVIGGNVDDFVEVRGRIFHSQRGGSAAVLVQRIADTLTDQQVGNFANSHSGAPAAHVHGEKNERSATSRYADGSARLEDVIPGFRVRVLIRAAGRQQSLRTVWVGVFWDGVLAVGDD